MTTCCHHSPICEDRAIDSASQKAQHLSQQIESYPPLQSYLRTRGFTHAKNYARSDCKHASVAVSSPLRSAMRSLGRTDLLHGNPFRRCACALANYSGLASHDRIRVACIWLCGMTGCSHHAVRGSRCLHEADGSPLPLSACRGGGSILQRACGVGLLVARAAAAGAAVGASMGN